MLAEILNGAEAFNSAYIILGCAFAGGALYIATRYVARRKAHPYHWKHVALAGIGGFLMGIGLSVNALARFEEVPAGRWFIFAGFLALNGATALLFRDDSEGGK